MRKPPPNGMDIRISMEDWDKLLAAEFASGFTLEGWEIGAQAVHDWLARNSPQTLSKPCTSGYQWKELFLPKGSLLRTVFNGKHYHCVVEDDGPRFNGEPTSPSRFANAVGGVRRNAWRVIWVLFPNTKEWKLADSLRTKRRAPTRRRATERDVLQSGDVDGKRDRSPSVQPPMQAARAKPRPAASADRRDCRPESRSAPPEARVPPEPALSQRSGHRAPAERRVADGERRRQPVDARSVQAPRDGRTPAAVASYGTGSLALPVTWRAPWAMAEHFRKNKRHPQVPSGWAGTPYT